MLKPRLITPDAAIASLNKRIGDTPDAFNARAQKDLAADGERYRKQLSTEPPRAWNYYKLPWASDRQRRAVMAKLRRAGNLPYMRTHELSQGWRVDIRIEANGDGFYALRNSAPQSQYVQGDLVQPMFRKIPWQNVIPVAEQAQKTGRAILLDVWEAVCHEAIEG